MSIRRMQGQGRVIAVLAAALLIAMTAGCGGEETSADGATEGTATDGTATDGTAADATGAPSTAGPAALEGETVDFVVPYEPGGGYDVYARVLAPYMEECSGATVVVRNEPGAGGLLATTQTFVASPDELRVQIVNSVGAVSAQIGEAEGAQFDLDDFSWLGRVSSEPNVLVVAADSEIASFDDLLSATEPVRFVATGPGSNEYVNSTIVPEVYGFPAEIITGFAGSGEARTAVLAGDADAHILPLDSQAEAIEAGDVRPILVIGQEAPDALADTPTVADYPPESEEQQAILDALVALVETGRAVVAPPGIDAPRLAALREALSCALSDDELLAETAAQQRPISAVSGEDMATLIAEVLDSPPAFQDLVRQAS